MSKNIIEGTKADLLTKIAERPSGFQNVTIPKELKEKIFGSEAIIVVDVNVDNITLDTGKTSGKPYGVIQPSIGGVTVSSFIGSELAKQIKSAQNDLDLLLFKASYEQAKDKEGVPIKDAFSITISASLNSKKK